jgi:hypothetical protein
MLDPWLAHGKPCAHFCSAHVFAVNQPTGESPPLTNKISYVVNLSSRLMSPSSAHLFVPNRCSAYVTHCPRLPPHHARNANRRT